MGKRHPGAYEQHDNLGQYSVLGPFGTNYGQQGVTGQSEISRQMPARYNPLAGNMREREMEQNVRMHNLVKLPKLELKRFNGDPIKRLDFWENFERNVINAIEWVTTRPVAKRKQHQTYM